MQFPNDGFSPDDLRAAIMLIDHACDRGAFRGWENVSKASIIRNKLATFVAIWDEAVAAQMANMEADNGPSTTIETNTGETTE